MIIKIPANFQDIYRQTGKRKSRIIEAVGMWAIDDPDGKVDAIVFCPSFIIGDKTAAGVVVSVKLDNNWWVVKFDPLPDAREKE